MSFSFSYVAKSRERAKEIADLKITASTPQLVADVIRRYVDGLPGSVPEDSFIHVTATGHMPNAANEYDQSGTFSVTVSVIKPE